MRDGGGDPVLGADSLPQVRSRPAYDRWTSGFRKCRGESILRQSGTRYRFQASAECRDSARPKGLVHREGYDDRWNAGTKRW